MVQFQVFSGKTAVREYAARRFPFRIGRSAQSDLRLEQPGIWDDHLELRFDREQGFILATGSQALASLNGESFREGPLRNGDTIEIGVLKIRFWLGSTVQSSLRWREWLTWAALGLITAGQLVLIYQLIR